MPIDIKENRILQHILFWLALLTYSTFFFGFPNHLLYWAKLSITILPVDMAYVYFTIYYLLPKYLLARKYLLFAALFILLGYVDEIILRLIAFEFYHNSASYTAADIFYGEGSFNIFSNYYFALVAIALRLYRIWNKENKLAQKTMADKFDAELKLKELELNILKSQLHPHFLFNTLNNLYGLILTKSDKSAEVVLKMSSLLNYMLYECNTDTVALKKEIDQVLVYISLEQLRYDDDLSINIENNCESTHHEIAPLLILPFIENCFKHGASNNVGKSWINIAFNCDNHSFQMRITNSIGNKSGDSTDIHTKGIGLKNVIKRLETLYFNKHDLQINEANDVFSVTLNLIVV